MPPLEQEERQMLMDVIVVFSSTGYHPELPFLGRLALFRASSARPERKPGLTHVSPFAAPAGRRASRIR